MTYNCYWGDLHNHCNISYGHGSLDRALAVARQQLDFASITGHAFWPDIPDPNSFAPEFARDLDEHLVAFRKLDAGWASTQSRIAAVEEPGRFLPFLGYEWHSIAFGDHHVVYCGTHGPLVTGNTLEELRGNLHRTGKTFILCPHHIGYLPGGRGTNWDAYAASSSPVVELYSLHGCSESDEAPYPMLNTLGPRDHGSTAQEGLRRGHRFGFVASTDHHAGYPGSYGEGRLAVHARALTREAIWEALHQRRTYAVTGDKIEARFQVNDAMFGQETTGNRRHIMIAAEGADFWDTIEIVKNGRVWRRWAPIPPDPPSDGTIRAKVRIEWGWHRTDMLTQWQTEARLEEGRIIDVETCFRGEPVVRPDEVASISEGVPHAIVGQDGRHVTWRSETRGNLSMRHATTQALILKLEAPLNARLRIEGVAGGKGFRFAPTLRELVAGARGYYSNGFLSPAIRVHRAVPESSYTIELFADDSSPEKPVDYYYARLAQRNSQLAWVTPVWVNST